MRSLWGSGSLLVSVLHPRSFVVLECGFRGNPDDPRSFDDAFLPPSTSFSEAEVYFIWFFSLLQPLLYLPLSLEDVSLQFRQRDSVWLDSLRGSSTTLWSMRALAVIFAGACP